MEKIGSIISTIGGIVVVVGAIGGALYWVLRKALRDDFVTQKEHADDIKRLDARVDLIEDRPDPITDSARQEKFDRILEYLKNERKRKRECRYR